MRIGYVHPNPFPSVVANIVQIVQMCRAFASMGHEVLLFIPRSGDFTSDAAAREKARELFGDPLPFELVFVPRKLILGRMEVLGSVRGTLNALRSHPVDLIYTRNPWSVPFLKRTGIPFVFESHDAHLHETSKLLGALLRYAIIRTSRHPRMVKLVAISEALVKVWKDLGVAPSKLVSAHDAVDLKMFETTMTQSEARSVLNLPDDLPIILYTGSLKPDRGIGLILDAALQLPDMRFTIVGGTPSEMDRVRAQIEKLNVQNVQLTGRVPHRDIPKWLASADILLMMWTWQVSTIRVCSPMKLFEYMAAKRLIVGPAFPTVLEVLDNGKDSILFEPDNIVAIVASLREARLKMRDSAMPDEAYRKVAAEYTWTARCLRIINSLPDTVKQK